MCRDCQPMCRDCQLKHRDCQLSCLFTESPVPVKVPENVVLPIAHTVRFTCQFSGNPTPVITWWKNGALIELDERIKVKPHDNMLITTQGMATDSGLYQCRAESRAGQAQHTVRLLIEVSGAYRLCFYCQLRHVDWNYKSNMAFLHLKLLLDAYKFIKTSLIYEKDITT